MAYPLQADSANNTPTTPPPSPGKPLGKNWVTGFIKRHESIKSRFARKYNYQRALREDPKAMTKLFDSLKALRKNNAIQLQDIYNFDETDFAMGLIATTRVVTRAEMLGKPHLIQPGQREWVTAIECVGSTGFVVLPCIIFKGCRLYHRNDLVRARPHSPNSHHLVQSTPVLSSNPRLI
ncbi:hypothetical protein ASPCAL10858 [Aspergillus calidoustus]|uniref:HTH CENPB-type domain-containing protein n=1 Tax=Aspergillus calidoustus TaxID=454130 RepID=A0A0U5G8V7_ASPCI|nr:hypothetical protein ASPCAL10858 [Aspergillus calidoustus]